MTCTNKEYDNLLSPMASMAALPDYRVAAESMLVCDTLAHVLSSLLEGLKAPLLRTEVEYIVGLPEQKKLADICYILNTICYRVGAAFSPFTTFPPPAVSPYSVYREPMRSMYDQMPRVPVCYSSIRKQVILLLSNVDSLYGVLPRELDDTSCEVDVKSYSCSKLRLIIKEMEKCWWNFSNLCNSAGVDFYTLYKLYVGRCVLRCYSQQAGFLKDLLINESAVRPCKEWLINKTNSFQDAFAFMDATQWGNKRQIKREIELYPIAYFDELALRVREQHYHATGEQLWYVTRN
jgi:hypothetical protein